MNLSTKPKLITTLVLAALLAGPPLARKAGADDKPAGGQPSEAEMMKMMMEMGTPGENHKVLAGFVGSWKYHTKFWMTSDLKAPPMESGGKSVTKAMMGGRYFQSTHTGKMQMPGPDGKMTDMEFQGMAIEGYDNAKKKFVGTWIDNMGTGIMHLEGTFDPATKTMTYYAEYEAMPGVKTKMRETITITDNNHHTLEFFEDHNGKEVKTMEITYTRR